MLASLLFRSESICSGIPSLIILSVGHEEVLRTAAAIRGKNKTLLFEGAATSFNDKLSHPRLKDIPLIKAARRSARVI